MKQERNQIYQAALLAAALALLAVVGWMQGALNRLRADPELGLTRVEPLENAPPVLAFTTVALGGFRGLIANVLWIRANELQMEGKYFEMVQLADWITKLEPHFTQVWVVQSWNMAYNISVKFSDPEDRWRWVKQGIALLRDDGLRYNPRETLLYRELAWFFQHKIGQNMDNAHMYYKARWADEMEEALGGGRPDFEALLRPQTESDSNRVDRLWRVYRMDPAVIEKVDQSYGPLDWRLPETHAIYWAVVGLAKSKPKELITLRRVIYQSLHLATLRGRLFFVEQKDGRAIRLAPNLALAERTHEAFKNLIAEDEENPNAIKIAHRNFLSELVYLTYSRGRVGEANRWLDILREMYPEVAPPPGVDAEHFAFDRLTQGEIGNLSRDRIALVIEGLIIQSYYSRAIDEEDRADGLFQMARRLWLYWQPKTEDQVERLGLEPFEEMAVRVRNQLLAPGGMDPVLAARLRTVLGVPLEEGGNEPDGDRTEPD